MTRPFEGRRSGKPLPGTLGAEAERLVREAVERQPGSGDKNRERLNGNDQPIRCTTPLSENLFFGIGGTLGLVAGNVTGGGGKATTTKT